MYVYHTMVPLLVPLGMACYYGAYGTTTWYGIIMVPLVEYQLVCHNKSQVLFGPDTAKFQEFNKLAMFSLNYHENHEFKRTPCEWTACILSSWLCMVPSGMAIWHIVHIAILPYSSTSIAIFSISIPPMAILLAS
jgi:hypothetical protein